MSNGVTAEEVEVAVDAEGRLQGGGVTGGNVGEAKFPVQWLQDLLALGRLVPYRKEAGQPVTGYTWGSTGETRPVEGEDDDGNPLPDEQVTYAQEFLDGVNNWLTAQGREEAVSVEAAVEIMNRFPAEMDTIFSSMYEIAARQYSVLVNGENIVVNGTDLEQASLLVPGTTINDAFLAVRTGAKHGVEWETLLMSARRAGTGEVEGSEPNLERTALRLKAAKKRFGSELLAYLHVAGPGLPQTEGPGGEERFARSLAEAVSTDIPNLTSDEHLRLLGLMKPLNLWDQHPQTTAVWSPTELEFLNKLEAEGGPAPTMEAPHSKDTVDDQLRSLYQSWFQMDPTETDLEEFRNHFTDQLTAYQQQKIPYDNPFMQGNQAGIVGAKPTDMDSISRTYLRAQPLYQDLYGNKPGGVNEETYIGQMQGVATRWLGPQAMGAGDAVRAGLRSGDPADVQRNIRSSGVGDDSPVYKNRLAQGGFAIRSVD
jgi:hypothetical protein